MGGDLFFAGGGAATKGSPTASPLNHPLCVTMDDEEWMGTGARDGCRDGARDSRLLGADGKSWGPECFDPQAKRLATQPSIRFESQNIAIR